MGSFYDEIPAALFPFIKKQALFFVATSPLYGGSINLSPKSSAGSFHLVHSRRIRYLDLTGSGNETISHLLQPGNGRITIMFVNIEEGSPNIVRIFGKGTVHERFSPEQESSFNQLIKPSEEAKSTPRFPPGTRAIIDISIHTCSTSCGYSVPIFQYVRERKNLQEWSIRMESMTMKDFVRRFNKQPRGLLPVGDEANGKKREPQSGFEAYLASFNTLSLDGLPGLASVKEFIDQSEKDRLEEKMKSHNDLDPLLDEPVPFTPIGSRSPITQSIQRQGLEKVNIVHVCFAFSLGCAVTAAILLGRT